MATVPITDGPTVGPRPTPTPFQNITAPAEAFGANVAGEVLGQAGKAAGETSGALLDYATKLQGIYNQQAADTKSQDAIKEIYDTVSKWRQNNTLGQAAATYPALQEQLEAIRQAHGGGLSPLASVEYNSQTRFAMRGVLNQTGEYAAEQGHLGIIQGANQNALQAASTYNAYPTLENEALAVKQAVESAHQFFASAGLAPDDPQVQAKIASYLAPMYANQAEALYTSGDLAGANAFVEQHKDVLTRDVLQDGESMYVKVERTLRVANAANDVATGVHNAIFGGGPAGVAPTADANLDAADRGRANKSSAFFEPTFGKYGASGIVANLYAESGVSANPAGSNDGGAAYGVFQAHQAYQQSFQEHMGFPIQKANLQQQEQFLQWDLTQGPDKAVGDQLRHATSAEQAAEIFMKGIERPRDQGPQAVANRQAIARQIAGGTFQPPPVAQAGSISMPGPSTNLNQWSVDALSRANAWAQAKYPGDVAAQERALGEAKKQIALTTGPIVEQQKAVFGDTLNAITGGPMGPIQSDQELDTRFPNLINQVSPQQYKQLHGYAEQEGRIPTPDQQATEVSLTGQLSQARAGQLDPHSINIEGAGLTPQQALPLLKERARLEGNPPKSEQDTFVDRMAKSDAGKQALVGLGISQAHNPVAYYQFIGALQEEMQTYQTQHPGATPNQQEQAQMIARVTAKVGGNKGIFGSGVGPDFLNNPGQSAFVVPPEAVGPLTEQWKKTHGGLAPSYSDIGKVWATYQRQQGHLAP